MSDTGGANGYDEDFLEDPFSRRINPITGERERYGGTERIEEMEQYKGASKRGLWSAPSPRPEGGEGLGPAESRGRDIWPTPTPTPTPTPEGKERKRRRRSILSEEEYGLLAPARTRERSILRG